MRNLFTISIVLFHFLAWSQNSTNIKVQGTVVDTKTSEPLLYVNVGIEGTNIGKATNSKGFFALEIPIEYSNKNVFISAVGYDKMSISISDLKRADNVNMIRLSPLTYGIESVEVSAKSLVLYRIISNAAKKINENYFNQPFDAYYFYYHSKHKEKDTISRRRDAEIVVADQTGYRNNRFTAFKNRFAKILQVKRNFSPNSLEDRKTSIPEILEFDIVRYPGNILELEYVNDYDLKLISENDLQWEISYKLDKPELSRTGDFFAKTYSGNITILKNNYEVVWNETKVFCPFQNPAGRSRASSKEMLNDVTYSFTTTYAKTKDKFILESIFLNKNYTVDNIKFDITSGLRNLKIEKEINHRIENNEFVDMKESSDSLLESLKIKYPKAVINP